MTRNRFVGGESPGLPHHARLARGRRSACGFSVLLARLALFVPHCESDFNDPYGDEYRNGTPSYSLPQRIIRAKYGQQNERQQRDRNEAVHKYVHGKPNVTMTTGDIKFVFTHSALPKG
jgi:hypothetical protein